MNNIVITLILPFLLCTSCELFKWKEESKTELEKLPPATQSGENTFGYLLNGNAIVVTNTLKITAIYQRGLLQLGGV